MSPMTGDPTTAAAPNATTTTTTTAAPASATTTTTIQPAWRTSEGIITALSAAFGAAVASLHLAGDSQIVQLGGLALMIAATVAHSWGRATVKAAAS